MNEWILCSKRMPVEHDSVWMKLYGTKYWKSNMWKTNSNEVIVTVEFDDGSRATTTSHTNDGEWQIEKKRKIFNCKVIAWMPLPLSYRK